MQPGEKHHLAALGKLELMFYKNLEIDTFYRKLIGFIDKELPIAAARPLTLKELRMVDEFTRSFFQDKLSRTELVITRAFVLAKFVEQRERMPRKPMIDIEQLPEKVKTAVKQFNLSPAEVKALEWSHYRSAQHLTNASNDTSNRVRNLVYENLAENKGHRALRKKLEEELFTEAGEITRNWKRVAISETNTAFNQGYLATLKPGEFAVGFSMVDACDYCVKHIKGRVYMVIDPARTDLDYENLDPDSKKYKEISYIYENALWTGKSNYGKSSSPRKRKDLSVGNKADNLEDREHHEMWMPITPLHVECRCRIIRINPDTMYVTKEGRFDMKIMNEASWKRWYEKEIQPKLDMFKKIGLL